MQRAESTTVVPASAEQLFDFLADPANLPDWQTGILSAELTSTGPIGVGSTARIVRALMGQRINADLALTVYDRPHRLVLVSEVSGVTAEATLGLTPRGAATELSFAITFTAQSLFMAPFEGMAAGAATADIAGSMARLAAHFSKPSPT